MLRNAFVCHGIPYVEKKVSKPIFDSTQASNRQKSKPV